MRIRYTRHARERMAERGITESDVEACIANPVQRIATKKVEYKGRVGGRMLKVGVAPDVDTASEKLIRTAMWEGRQ